MKALLTLARLTAVFLFVIVTGTPAHAVKPIISVHIHGPGCVPGCAQGGGNPGNTPTGAPIDGGASLLLAGGAMYAVRRIRKARTSPVK